MSTCSRCKNTFNPAQNETAECNFHPGAPLFHEGLKSWSCCNSKNKPVLSFDEWLAIPPCASGPHTTESIQPVAPVQTSGNDPTSAPIAVPKPSADTPKTVQAALKQRPEEIVVPEVQKGVPLEDDFDEEGAKIEKGAKCLRCKSEFTGDEESRKGVCNFHAGHPVFHEGSKGYSCCKRKVLEFDEFLKIEPCKTLNVHVFIGQNRKLTEDGLEKVDCRTDFYQTPDKVIVSVFGKGADKEKASVKFDEWEMQVDLALPNSKQFSKKFVLFGPISAEACTFRILGTKCEITLAKADGRSWGALEAHEKSSGTFTFGVEGRTGTIGAKEMVLAKDNVR